MNGGDGNFELWQEHREDRQTIKFVLVIITGFIFMKYNQYNLHGKKKKKA